MKIQTFDDLCKSYNTGFSGDDVIGSVYGNMFKAIGTVDPGGALNSPRQSPLQVENLDGLMTEVLVSEKHFKLFNSIPRVPSPTLYYEYNRHKSFGARRGSLGFSEGGAPKGSVSQFSRSGVYNKYMGVQGGITHQMLVQGQNGGTVEDPQTIETRDRTLELFERTEREFIFADSTILDENGNAVHFDGLLKQLAAGNAANVIDLKGEPLSYANFDAAAENFVVNGKMVSVDGFTSFMSAHVTQGLNEQYKDRNIVRLNKDSARSADFTPGFKVPGYETAFGTFAFETSILLEEIENSAGAALAISGVPSTAVAATLTPAAGGTLVAGTYYYKVAAFNDTGEALLSPASAGGVADQTNGKISVAITKPAGNVTGYRIYRASGSSTGVYKWIARVPDATGATFVDDGSWCTYDADGASANGMAVLIKPDPRDLVMSQMMPLIKMPLPQQQTTLPFLLLLYCALVLKAPERVMIFKNCGKYKASAA